MTRRETFDALFTSDPACEVDKHLDLDAQRFIAVEQDATPSHGQVYVTGHVRLPEACAYLATAPETGWWPLFVLDLDTGERVEVETTVTVTPRQS